MYLYGEGVEENGIEAVAWLRKAGDQGGQTALDAKAILATINLEAGVAIPSGLSTPREQYQNLQNLPLRLDSNLEQTLKFWYKEANELIPNDVTEKLSEPIPGRTDLHLKQLTGGLIRLSGSAEFTRNDASRQDLANRIVNVIKQAAANPLVKMDVFEQCQFFSGTCHDGHAEALLRLENSAAILQHVGKTQGLINNRAASSLKSALKESALIEATRQHAALKVDLANIQYHLDFQEGREEELRVADPVEFNLSYLTKLKRGGALSIGPSIYRYRAEGTDVSNADLDEIKQAAEKPEVLQSAVRRLASESAWESAIIQLRPETQCELDKIKAIYDQNNIFEASISPDADPTSAISRTQWQNILPFIQHGIQNTRSGLEESHSEFTQRVGEANRDLEAVNTLFENQKMDSIKLTECNPSNLYQAYAWSFQAKKEDAIANATVAWMQMQDQGDYQESRTRNSVVS